MCDRRHLNRHERRKAKNWRAGDGLLVEIGYLLEEEPDYGVPVDCDLCGAVHGARGFARIERRQSITVFMLCEPCFQTGDISTAVMRKFCNAPDIAVLEQGEVPPEHLIAWAHIQFAKVH
jgi:hypothetical protein